MSDTVDVINKEFDDYQSLLCLKEKKLKLLVDFSDSDECDKLISLLGDIVYSVKYELVVKEDNESVTYSLIPVLSVKDSLIPVLSVKDSLISHIVLLVDIRVFKAV